MEVRNDNNLFFTCSLIEYIARIKHLERDKVVEYLGEEVIKRIYKYADVLHCEPIAKVADEFINECNIKEGNFDNVEKCKYEAPDYWTMGAVYERLIEDVFNEEQVLNGIKKVYTSWMNTELSNYNTDLFYQARDYLAECYKKGEIL